MGFTAHLPVAFAWETVSVWRFLPLSGAPACWGTPAEEGRMQHGIRTDAQAEDSKLLNSDAQNLSPLMLKKLILMLARTKLLQTGPHVHIPQPCCPLGWAGDHWRRWALQ